MIITTLKERLARRFRAEGECSLAEKIAMQDELSFNVIINSIFLGMSDVEVDLLKASHGIDCERLSIKKIGRKFYPMLSTEGVNAKVNNAVDALMHPLRTDILLRALAGKPYPTEGQGRSVTVLRVSIQALDYLWKGDVFTLADLAHKSKNGTSWWTIPGTRKCVQEEIQAAMKS